MQKDPFIILGISENATQNELYEAYRKARNKYIDKRFAPGSEGTEACEMLDSIEAAYREADEIIKNTYRTLMTRGMKGCYVYCCDQALADYLRYRLQLEPDQGKPIFEYEVNDDLTHYLVADDEM